MITELELDEFTASIFTGITVGVGSLVFLFSSGASILVQCPFQCGKEGAWQLGHGEDISTCPVLFPSLNIKVQSVKMLEGYVLKIILLNGVCIFICPEGNGLESYVINTRHGECPVITY